MTATSAPFPSLVYHLKISICREVLLDVCIYTMVILVGTVKPGFHPFSLIEFGSSGLIRHTVESFITLKSVMPLSGRFVLSFPCFPNEFLSYKYICMAG